MKKKITQRRMTNFLKDLMKVMLRKHLVLASNIWSVEFDGKKTGWQRINITFWARLKK